MLRCSSAIGALAAQLAATRRVAAGLAGGALGAALLVRALAASVDGAGWLSWLSPLGWVDRSHPLTGTNVAPMLLVVAAVVVLLAVAVVLATHRDLAAALGPSRDVAATRSTLLGSPLLLSLRLTRGVTIAWAVGVSIGAGVFGIVSTAVSESFSDNKSVSDIFSRLGADVSARGYIGVTFVMMATLLGYAAATYIGACRTEEAEGRLEYLAAGPLRRQSWLAGRLVVATGALVLFGLAIGLGGWIGVVVSGGHIPLGAMALAGLNAVPPALVVLGFGTLALGLAPRAGVGVAYALVAWSFMLEMIGAFVKLNHFVLDTSVIHHIAAAPAVDPRVTPAVVMLGLAATSAALGTVALQRRDIASG